MSIKTPVIRFHYLETARWPHPGIDMFRFGVWFSIDGLDLSKLNNKQKSIPYLLRRLARDMDKHSNDMKKGIG